MSEIVMNNMLHGVYFGAEGWPPPFRSLVREMRRTIVNETGKNADCLY